MERDLAAVSKGEVRQRITGDRSQRNRYAFTRYSVLSVLSCSREEDGRRVALVGEGEVCCCCRVREVEVVCERGGVIPLQR